jgi:hypothetical protein
MHEAARGGNHRPERFTYYMHDGSAALRFQLAGDLSKGCTSELDQARLTASSVFDGRPFIVDLTGIGSMDCAGGQLIARWHGLGAQFVVATQEAKSRIGSVTGIPIGLVERTRRPKRVGGSTVLWLAVGALVIILILMEQVR